MKITRMYTGNDGRSHFEDLEMPFDPALEAQRTDVEGTKGIQFVFQPPGFVIDMHPAPRRQYVITVQGQAEIEMGDGTVRRFAAGDIVLADDLTGEGHITRIIGDTPRISAQVSLDA
jgi:quercetin dioxygenase-like cupin family protein